MIAIDTKARHIIHPKLGTTRAAGRLASFGTAARLAVMAVFLTVCRRPDPPPPTAAAPTAEPLPHHAFVWQRQWTPAVSAAVRARGQAFASLGVFGGQIDPAAAPAPTVVKPAPDWNALNATGRPVAQVIRIENRHAAPPFSPAVASQLLSLVNNFTSDAGRSGVPLAEVVVDYDCAQSKLTAYADWVAQIRKSLTPRPVHITGLPSWLAEPTLPSLLDSCDGWILQLHSFDLTRVGRRPAICDPAQASAWVEQATRLGRPFAVALSTYRATAGLDERNRQVGLALEGPAPAWPPGTLQIDLDSDPVGLAHLVAHWSQHRPPHLQAVWWYRLPVDTDVRNWRWVTLQAAMSGRAPSAKWDVVATGTNPVDFAVRNTGDADGQPPSQIHIIWPDHAPAAADALRGWTVDVSAVDGRVTFTAQGTSSSSKDRSRAIPPKTQSPIGWIRYHEDAPSPDILRIQIDR